MTKIIISSNAQAMKKEISKFKNSATVEAEYGNEVVEGSLATLAHHAEGFKN